LSLPPEFEEEYGKDKVLKLKRSIYDFPQSGRKLVFKIQKCSNPNKFKTINLGKLHIYSAGQKASIAIST